MGKRPIIEVNGSPVVFVIVGIIFVIIGRYMLGSFENFAKNAVEVEATVHTERIKNDIYNDQHDSEILFAEYEFNNHSYYERYGKNTSAITIGPIRILDSKEGDKIKIYVDTDNPENFRTKSSEMIGYCFIGMGTLCVVLIFIYIALGKK